jgi:hypothetical protein
MLFLFLLTLVCVRAQPLLIDTLQCHNSSDLHSLLYHICNKSVLCRELYALEGQADDREKFAHQLSLIALFNENTTQSVSQLFVSQLWPDEWMPYYLVQYNGSGESCGARAVSSRSWLASTRTEEGPGRTFVYAASYMMVVYAQYIGNKQYCNDHNERLQYDPVDRTFQCECRSGKICNNSEATSNSLITFGVVAIILAILALFVITVYDSMQLSKYV